MSDHRQVSVLLVEEHEEIRTLFLESLNGAGCVVHPAVKYDDVVPLATAMRTDVAVVDIRFDAVSLAVAEGLAALPNRPRLIGVTDVPTVGTWYERLFDAYLEAPCLPEDLVEVVRSV